MPPTWKCRRSASVSMPRAVAGSMAWRVSTASMGTAPGEGCARMRRGSSHRETGEAGSSSGNPMRSEKVVAARGEGVDQHPRFAERAAAVRDARGDHERVARADDEGLAAEGELEAAGLHEGRLH